MPISNRVFATGGIGEEWSKSCKEVVPSAKGTCYKVVIKAHLRYEREFHSMCYLTPTLIFVSGSRSTKDGADKAVEVFDVDRETWTPIEPLTKGRCRHSSCGFAEKFVYIFCGMIDRRRVNSIERLDYFGN